MVSVLSSEVCCKELNESPTPEVPMVSYDTAEELSAIISSYSTRILNTVITVKPVYSDHLWAAKSGLSREVVSLQRSESIVQALLGHDQVVFIERWSLDTSGLYCTVTVILLNTELTWDSFCCRVSVSSDSLSMSAVSSPNSS